MHSNDDSATWWETATSRRATLVAAGTAVGALGGTGLGRARQDGDGGATGDRDGLRARIYASDFHADARFRVVSRPLDYEPEVEVQEGEAFLADLYWAGHETRVARYENTRERVLFFPPVAAPFERGRVYRTGTIRSTAELADGVVTVGVDPAGGGDRNEGDGGGGDAGR